MEIDSFKKKINDKSENLFVIIEDPVTKKKIKYSIYNHVTLWRAQTLFSKEPITIKWIREFKKNSIFFDVGANVGMYTIFAASVNNTHVYSFEPESNNFQVLTENIFNNDLVDFITPYPIGISDKNKLTNLFISKFEKGGSHHMVDESLDHNLREKNKGFHQGIFTTTLNDLINKWDLPKPNYLKIDVDGIENKIIAKSEDLLSSTDLQSILIEINPNRDSDKEIILKLQKFGFNYDQSQVDLSTRKSGKHMGYAEYLFFK